MNQPSIDPVAVNEAIRKRMAEGVVRRRVEPPYAGPRRPDSAERARRNRKRKASRSSRKANRR